MSEKEKHSCEYNNHTSDLFNFTYSLGGGEVVLNMVVTNTVILVSQPLNVFFFLHWRGLVHKTIKQLCYLQ